MNKNPLIGNAYPGRGLALGLSPDRKAAIQVYWTMGRSENSKNRILVAEGDLIKTKPFIDKDIKNPELIIYNAAMRTGPYFIATNGRQTDSIYEGLASGKCIEESLTAWEFEDDPPIYTPRISGVTKVADGKMCYWLHIIKSDMLDASRCLKQSFFYSAGNPGVGHCIHTYAENGDPCPSFHGEPFEVSLLDGLEENMSAFWDILPADYIVAMLVKRIDLASGQERFLIKNRHI